MESFWDFCAGVRDRLTTPEPTERPSSPPSLEFCYDCANYLCVNTTKDISSWKLVQKKKRQFYFCKHECWEEWLEELR
jgi:hypothetical protein